MATVAEHVPFMNISKLCQKVSERKGHGKKAQPLVEFIDYWRKFHGKLHTQDPTTTDSFFPALRLLLPQCERQRAAYGIKEFTLAKLLIEIFCLDKNGVDAQKLINYRSPKSANAEAGDFASVAYFVLKKRSPEKGSLTVHDINYHLDCIANNHASKNKDELRNDLLHLFRNTSALEQKWLIRIILKDMKMGISENSVFKTFHLDARSLYDVTNSLEKVCTSLRDPSVRLHEIEISLFTSFRPMLSEMALPNQVEKLMHSDSFIIETKYDGERLQLHKDGDSYMYFSRGGFDCTSTYGCSPLQGNLTPFIHKCFKSSVRNCILDGEIVIYSNKLNCIVSKGENADFQAMAPDGEYAPCFCVFDVVLLNDKVLTNCPLAERVPLIADIFTPVENKIRCTEQLVASTNAEVMQELNKAIDDLLEGIIIKNPSSIYKPNVRKHGGWLKVKPEYVEGVMTELDLLIIGGYYGEGKRSNILSQFLLGVASNEKYGDGSPKCFYAFCKVGSGYSERELHELAGRLKDNWQPFDPKKCPRCLMAAGLARSEQPDMWIEPSKSYILQIKASEINRSKAFPTNYTLRFPRVVKIRYDKPWTDCMTMTELDDLRNMAQGRLALNKSTASEDEPSPKKPKIAKGCTITIAPHFRPTDTSNIQKISDLFKDKEMCMIFFSLEKKQNMEKLIVEQGGKCVQNPGSSTFCVICDKVTAKVKNIIKTNSYDVVASAWVEKCAQKNTLIPWVPDDLFHATAQTVEKMEQDFDKFGDSYADDINEQDLRKIFNRITKEDCKNAKLSSEEVSNLEKEFFLDSSPYGLFRDCCFHIKIEMNGNKASQELENKSELLQSILKLYGGGISSTDDEDATHIVILNDENPEVSSSDVKRGGKQLVSEKWILESISKGKLLEIDSLIPEGSSDDSLF